MNKMRGNPQYEVNRARLEIHDAARALGAATERKRLAEDRLADAVSTFEEKVVAHNQPK